MELVAGARDTANACLHFGDLDSHVPYIGIVWQLYVCSMSRSRTSTVVSEALQARVHCVDPYIHGRSEHYRIRTPSALYPLCCVFKTCRRLSMFLATQKHLINCQSDDIHAHTMNESSASGLSIGVYPCSASVTNFQSIVHRSERDAHESPWLQLEP